ncbi:MAG TPA: hypothetical protein PK156_20730 [Polyangium sp.]|nr:hypothetical protein [Polyangium sp.]
MPPNLRPRKFAFAAGVIAALGAMSTFACAPVTNRLLLYPSRDELPLNGAERVMAPHQEGAIETIRAKSPGALHEPIRAIVLRFYGNADRADSWPAEEAQSFGKWPVEVWGVNYPGFGHSVGNATLAGVARAANVAFGEASKRGLPIFVMGTSMGTTAALHLAANHQVNGLFLQNPPPLAQLIRGRHGWWNLWILAGPISLSVPPSVDSLSNARRAKAPALVISSEDDNIVPFTYQTDVFDAYAGPKQRIVLPGAGHNDAIPDTVWVQIHQVLQKQGWGL